MKSQKHESPQYEYPIHDINWTTGVGRPAGVYWLDGRTTIAAHDSVAESVLLEQGAILIATLLFERDPLESRHRGRTVESVPARTAAADYLLSAAN